MPLAFRTIQPASLGRRPLSEDEGAEDVAPIAVCHNAFLGAIVQLASLVRHADDLFCDLAEECQRVFEKTESIFVKIQNIQRITTQVDSTQVTIPVGTLKQFSAVTDHHVAKHGFDCDHFTPANRPYCIRFNYSMCELTPVHLLRGVDPFRKDGLSSSHLFKLWPIALKETDWHANDMSVSRRYSSPLAHKKRYKSLKLKERRRTIHSIDEIYHKETSAELQASKSGSLSKSQPSIMVSVDTSGSGFDRMILFRRSLSGDRLDGRGKRRQTVSGVPDNILQEIEHFETGHRIVRDRPRMYSLEDLDQTELDARDEIMQQYLVEIDSAIAEREEEEYVEQREKKLLKFIPCRRSRSLPRCVKLLTSRGRGELTLSSMFPKKLQHKHQVDETKVKHAPDEVSLQDKFSSNASLGSLSGGEDSKSVRSSKRSSLIGDKIKSLVANTLKPRPKSLDFDSIEVIDDRKGTSRSKSERRSSSLSRVNSPGIPEGTMTRTSSTESQVGPGSYYYFDSNTIPRAQAKKYDFPWDSLPKDWTTSVKLREISKRRKEDRQSSSGNWSQSGYSSNRQSVDSAKSSVPSTVSQCSLGKDSGRDSPRSAGERDGLDTGYMGDAASNESISDTKSLSNTDSDDWIRSLAEQAANRGDVTSTSAEALASLSRLTKQNIRNLDILIPGRTHLRQKRNELEDDGESSIYSVDQEGFYTSFHSDSGLKRSTNTLLDDDDEDYDLIMPRVRETKSLQSVIGYSSMRNGGAFMDSSSAVSAPDLASVSFGNPSLPNISEDDAIDVNFSEEAEGEVEYGNSGTLKAKKKQNKMKKVPPLPPPRTTSVNSSNNQTQSGSDEALNSLDDSPTSVETSSESSDHETIYARLKMKTSISAHTFPSWCVGLASDEDELQDRLHAESSEVEELFSGKDSWISGTLPRTNAASHPNEIDQATNSWPRIKRVNPQHSGILKTTEKDKTKPAASNPKVLNFDPVVNLFDATSPHSVQMPLSRLSSSDESSSPSTYTFDAHPLSGKNSKPPSLFSNQSVTKADSCIKDMEQLSNRNEAFQYQPALVGKHATTRPRSMVLHQEQLGSSSTPVHGYSSGSAGNTYFNSSDLSILHSASNPSLDSTDSFSATLMTPLMKHDRTASTINSNSTIALSDIDTSSLTYVTMSDSSPSGSSLSLNWDTDDTPNPTPMATPVRKHAPFSVSSSNNTTTAADRSSSDILKFDASGARQTHVPSLPDHARSSNMLSTASSNQEKKGVVWSDDLRHPFYNSGSTGSNLISSHLSPEPSYVGQSSTVSKAPTSSGVTQITHSDKNNNRSKDTNFVHADSVALKQEFRTQGITDQKHVHPLEHQLQPPLTGGHIHTNAPISLGNFHQQMMRTSHTERRRSSPSVATAAGSSGSTSNSGNEDSSETKGSKVSDSVKRRRSDLYSTSDSGYGSPPVSSQPSSQVFTYSSSKTPQQQYSSIVHAQVRSSHAPSSSLLNTEPTNRDSKSFLSKFASESNSTSVSNIVRPDYPQTLRRMSNQSTDSLSSQFSVSSTQQLIPKVPKTDLSQPTLHRENSTESMHSNSSGARSDSYRVAMSAEGDDISLIPNKISSNSINSNNTNSNSTNSNSTSSNSTNSNSSILRKTRGEHRSQLTKSLPAAAPAVYEDDAVGRADSYRCAVRNTQSLMFADAYGRNSSYRLATCEEDVVITDSRMDACNLWTGKTGATRDVRRMGITDVDQLKHYNNESDDNDKSGNRRSLAKISNTVHAKKKLSAQAETEGLINPQKSSSSEHKRFMRPSSKDKTKQKTQSSTYIRFDPIFESGEDLRASNESLRPPSIVSIRTLTQVDSCETSDNTNLIRGKVTSSSPPRKRSSSQGRRDDKSSLSIFGSIKTTIRSIGGTKGD